MDKGINIEPNVIVSWPKYKTGTVRLQMVNDNKYTVVEATATKTQHMLLFYMISWAKIGILLIVVDQQITSNCWWTIDYAVDIEVTV